MNSTVCAENINISTLCFKLLTSFKCYLVTDETCLVLLFNHECHLLVKVWWYTYLAHVAKHIS